MSFEIVITSSSDTEVSSILLEMFGEPHLVPSDVKKKRFFFFFFSENAGSLRRKLISAARGMRLILFFYHPLLLLTRGEGGNAVHLITVLSFYPLILTSLFISLKKAKLSISIYILVIFFIDLKKLEFRRQAT